MKKIIVFILLASSILTGCSNSEILGTESRNNTELKSETIDKSENVESLEQIDFPETFHDNIDNVLFETDIHVSNQGTITQYVVTTATLQRVDHDRAFAEFYSNIPTYDTYENETKNERDENVTAVTYVDPDEVILSVGPYSSAFSYSRKELTSYVNRSFRLDEKYDDYNADKYSTEVDFSFSSKEEAYLDIQSKLGEIGIIVENTYNVYSLDYATMEQEERYMGMDGREETENYKQNWTEDDNCYYFSIGQEYNGLPVYHVFSEVFKLKSDINAPIQAIYSKNGIESIYAERVFFFAEKETPVQLKEFEEIAKTVTAKFSMILGDSSYKVIKAELNYMVDVMNGKGEYEVFPVWILNVEESTPAMGVVGELQIIINAMTGEEVL